MRTAVAQLNFNPEHQDSSSNLGESDRENILQGTYLRDVILRSFQPPSQSEPIPESEVPQEVFEEDHHEDDIPSRPLKGLFGDDMRIQSWAGRYSDLEPLAVEGDPILRDLNATQIRAVAMMLSNRISLVQGVRDNLHTCPRAHIVVFIASWHREDQDDHRNCSTSQGSVLSCLVVPTFVDVAPLVSRPTSRLHIPPSFARIPTLRWITWWKVS